MSYYIAHMTDAFGRNCARCGCALPVFTPAQLRNAPAEGYDPDQLQLCVWPPGLALYYHTGLRVLMPENRVSQGVTINRCAAL